MSAYQDLLNHLTDIHNLYMAGRVLSWDLDVNMPSGGSQARAAQLGTISKLRHQLLTSDTTAHLLESAAQEVAGMDADSDEVRLVEVVTKDYEMASRLPSDLVQRLTRSGAQSRNVWIKARAESDFSQFADSLKQILELALEKAEYIGYESNPYDACIYQYERDLTAADIQAIFDGHKSQLVELVNAAPDVDNAMLYQKYDVDKQKQFALKMVEAIGFDFTRGRQDVSVHPFSTYFSKHDVRLTTRFNEGYLGTGLFGLLHEAGHGIYAQGLNNSLEGTPLTGETSLSVDESQSRLWENVVGRSKEFWEWALPQLKSIFPYLVGARLDDFYRAVNTIKPLFIRLEADEATYNLHIILRFELENDLLNGRVAVDDLPREWNQRFEASFGIVPPNDAQGVLQDIHWSAGALGYFPTYALGNLLSVQYYEAALQAYPNIPADISQGQFDVLRGWLTENIYQHGRKFGTAELTQRITGKGIDSQPYIAYLQRKYL